MHELLTALLSGGTACPPAQHRAKDQLRQEQDTDRSNPSLGPLEKGPFYALRCDPGDLDTKGGLQCDEHARVVNSSGEAVPGLYAAGNTSAAVMGNTYPGAGATIGSAMTFAYIAAQHAFGETVERE